MKRICTILAFILCTFTGYAQFEPGPSVRTILGSQTTNNKYLVIIGDGLPNFTPTADTNAYLYVDTTALMMYTYSGGSWGNLNKFDYIDFNVTDAPVWQERRIFYDTLNKALAVYDDESETSLQVGQEVRVRVFNNNGVTIANGSAVSVVGVTTDGAVQVELAIANDATSALNTIGIATHDIEAGTYGWATTAGVVNDVNTSSYTEGAALYLSDSIAGAYTETRPVSPSWEVRMGGVIESDVSTGKIYAELRIINNDQDNNSYFNGAILESNRVDIVSNGTTVNLSLNSTDANGRLSLIFDQDYISVADGINIDLTLGTDAVPVENWVYIDPTGTMQVSLSGFPTGTQYTPVAQAVVPSAATAQTYGLYKLHAYTDHLQGSNGQGHLSHLNDWVRKRPPAWQSGVVLTQSVSEGTAADTIDLSYTSGSISQLHPHTFPIYNTATKPAFVVNDVATPYELAEGLTPGIDTDADGESIGNNKYYNLVVWGVVSEETKDCKIFFNLPSGSYTQLADALNDVDNTAIYTIPTAYLGTGFLITKMTIKRTTSQVEVQAGGTIDLRGSIPAAGGGSTIGGAGITLFDDLTDTPISKVGSSLKGVRVNVGENALEYYDIESLDGIRDSIQLNNTTTNYLPYWDGDSWEDSYIYNNTVDAGGRLEVSRGISITDSTQGLSFKAPTSGSSRYGLKYGSDGSTGDNDNLMLTNREANGALLLATSGATGGGTGEVTRIEIESGGDVNIKSNLFLESVTTDNTNANILALDPISGEVESVTLATIQANNTTTNYLPYWDGDSWEDAPVKLRSGNMFFTDGNGALQISYTANGNVGITGANAAFTDNRDLKLTALDSITFAFSPSFGTPYVFTDNFANFDANLRLQQVTTDNTNTNLLALDPVSGEVESVTADNLDLGITTDYLPYWDGDSWESTGYKYDEGTTAKALFMPNNTKAARFGFIDGSFLVRQGAGLNLTGDSFSNVAIAGSGFLDFSTNSNSDAFFRVRAITTGSVTTQLEINSTYSEFSNNLRLADVTTDNTNTNLLALDPVSGEVESVTLATIQANNTTTDYLPYWDGDSWEDSYTKISGVFTLIDAGNDVNFIINSTNNLAIIGSVNDAVSFNKSMRIQADSLIFSTNNGKFIWNDLTTELMRLDLDGSLFLSNVTTDNTNTDLLALDPVSGEVESVTADNLDLGITTNYIPYWDGDSWEDSGFLKDGTVYRFDLGSTSYLTVGDDILDATADQNGIVFGEAFDGSLAIAMKTHSAKDVLWTYGEGAEAATTNTLATLYSDSDLYEIETDLGLPNVTNSGSLDSILAVDGNGKIGYVPASDFTTTGEFNVGVSDADYNAGTKLVASPEVRSLHIFAVVTTGASSDVTITLPVPSATHNGKKVYIKSLDESATYAVTLDGTTNGILNNASITSTLNWGDSSSFVLCQLNPATSVYYWVVY